MNKTRNWPTRAIHLFITLALVVGLSLGTVTPVLAAADGTMADVDTGGVVIYAGVQAMVQEVTITDAGGGDAGSLDIDCFTVSMAGTAVNAEVASVSLWLDGGDGVFDAGGADDTQIGATVATPNLVAGVVIGVNDDTLCLSVADGTVETVFVAITLATTGLIDGHTITTTPDGTDLVAASVSTWAGASLVAATSAATIDTDLAIADVAIAAATHLPGATNVAVQQLSFTLAGAPNAAHPINVQTVKVSNVGSDTYVTKVALWEDIDDDGAFEPLTDDITGLLGEGTFTSGAIVIGTMGVTLFDVAPNGGLGGADSQAVFVVYDISSLSPDGTQFRSRIVNPTLDVTFDMGTDPAIVAVTSTNPQTVSTAITIADAANNPGAGNIGAGVTNFVVQGLNVLDCGTGTDIDVVSIDNTGTATFGVDVTKVSLWKDDGDTVFDANSDTLLGSDTTPTDAATTIGAADVVLTSLTALETATLWITVDTSATADEGDNIQTRIGDAIADISVTTASLGTALDAVNARTGGVQTIRLALAIATLGNPAAATVGAGQTNVLVQGFTVTDSGNAAGTDIDVVTIDETGTADFGTVATSDVTKISLWRDDGDGVFDVNSDTLLGSDITPGVISTIGTADVLLTNVANAAVVQFWVTVDVQATCTATTPTDTQTINTRIGNQVTDISVTSGSQGQQLAGVSTQNGAAQTIERNIAAADTAPVNPAAGTTGVGQSNVLIKAFTLTDSGNAAGSDIDIVTIDQTGTATFGSASTTDVSKVSLWRDDGDGVFSAVLDTLLGEDITPAATSTIGTANVVLTNVADGATATFFITVDVRTTATDGLTIILVVDNAVTDIGTTATSQGLQLGAGPVLTNNAQTIDRNLAIANCAAPLNPVAAAIGVSRTDVLIHGFTVTDSGNDAGTDIDIVNIDEINTAVFGTDVTKVSLWQDTGTTGFQGTGVDTLLGEDTTPGLTSTIGSHDVVLVNVPDGLPITLFITVDIPSTATDGRIIQTRVGDVVTDISVTTTSQGLQLAGAGAIQSNAKTIDYNVAAVAAGVLPALGTTTGKGATDVLVQAFTVTDSGNGGGTQIDTVSIDRDAAQATANFAADITKVSLWLDRGVAGFQGAGVDTLLGENTSPANEGTVIGTAETVLVNLARAQVETLYVTVDTSTGIATGTTIATQIGDEANDVSVTSTSIGQGTIVAVINSANPVTVADILTIALGPSNPAAQSLVGGQTDVLVEAFRLTGAVVPGGTDIDTMTIEETGTADWAGDPGIITNIDVSKISLWRDEGAAGFQGTGVDTLLGSSTSPLGIGTTFGTPETVLTHLDSGQAVQFLVTIDTAENADDDATVQTTIGDEQVDITVTTASAGQDLGGAFATAGNAHRIHRFTSAATLSTTYTLNSVVVVRVDASLGVAFAGTVTVETDEPAGTVIALDDGAGYDGTAADGIFYAQFLTESVDIHSGTVYMNDIAKATIAYNTGVGALATIVVSPGTPTVAVGATQQFTATGYDSEGSPITISPTWSSTDTDVGVIDVTGLFTANADGITTVKATIGAIVGTASVTVGDAPPPPPIEDQLEDAGIEDETQMVYYYDNATKAWSYYWPGVGGDLDNLTTGTAYWINLSADCVINGVQYYAGWNIVVWTL